MNPSPEQLASAIKTINDAFAQGQMRGMFVARPLFNDVNIIAFPGYHVSPESEQDVEQITRQLYQAAITDSAIDRGHLIAANRRRKRAERKLKKQREMYRYAMERNADLLRELFERNRKS